VRIETPALLSDDVAEEFCKLYRTAFEPLDVLAAARQSLTDEEFLEELAHPSVFKWLVYDDFDRPCALSFMTNDLTTVPWVSIPFYKARFPDHFERKAIYYFGGLLVHPEYQGSSVVKDLLVQVMLKVGADDAICAFDCCGFNVDVKRFPKLVGDFAELVNEFVDLQEVDVQRYYAYVMKGNK